MPSASREIGFAGTVLVVTSGSWIPAVLFSRAKIPQATAVNMDLFFAGESIECGPGDSIFTRKGERAVWDIQQDVTKIFFTHLGDGNPD